MRVLVPVLALAGCVVAPPPLTVEQQIALSCRGYAGTLEALTPFKARLTLEQIAWIDTANPIVENACSAVAAGAEPVTDTALIIINDNLRRLVILESETKGD